MRHGTLKVIDVNSPLHHFSLNWRAIHERPVRFAAIGIGLTLLHLILTWRLMRQTDQLVINALFWFAILGTMLNRLDNTRGARSPRVIGLALLGVIAARSCAIPPGEAWFVRLFPALAVLSLGLLLSGFRLTQHWRAGLLLMPLMIPRGLLEKWAEGLIGQPVQLMTAKFAAFVLHYAGYDTVQRNTIITLDQGAVDVLFRCTGVPLLILLFQLALLFFVIFPLSRLQRVKIILAAIAIAFLLSSLRVAMMAVVVQDRLAFDYWHGGNGSQIFSTGAIVLFGWLCQRSLPRVQID